jgi:hypothetical protein
MQSLGELNQAGVLQIKIVSDASILQDGINVFLILTRRA